MKNKMRWVALASVVAIGWGVFACARDDDAVGRSGQASTTGSGATGATAPPRPTTTCSIAVDALESDLFAYATKRDLALGDRLAAVVSAGGAGNVTFDPTTGSLRVEVAALDPDTLIRRMSEVQGIPRAALKADLAHAYEALLCAIANGAGSASALVGSSGDTLGDGGGGDGGAPSAELDWAYVRIVASYWDEQIDLDGGVSWGSWDGGLGDFGDSGIFDDLYCRFPKLCELPSPPPNLYERAFCAGLRSGISYCNRKFGDPNADNGLGGVTGKCCRFGSGFQMDGSLRINGGHNIGGHVGFGFDLSSGPGPDTRGYIDVGYSHDSGASIGFSMGLRF